MEFLKKLTSAYSPSGDEEKVRELILSEISKYADEIKIDNIGNLIVRKKGNGKKILLTAHIDEVGLLVNYIEENGFLRFLAVGCLDPFTLLHQKVEFENGVLGVVSYEEEIDLKKELDFSKMYIDIGVTTLADAEKLISIGDSAVFKSEFHTCGDCVISKALDDRIGVYVLVSVLKELTEPKNDLYFVFTAQEELGARGAKASANYINPDIGLAVDVTRTGDTPNSKRMSVKLGEGPCIKFMDTTIITHKSVNDALKFSAKETGVAVQYEVLTSGGTDAGAIHTSGVGVMTGVVSVPARYIHTPCEMVSMNDVKGAIRLISHFVNQSF